MNMQDSEYSNLKIVAMAVMLDSLDEKPKQFLKDYCSVHPCHLCKGKVEPAEGFLQPSSHNELKGFELEPFLIWCSLDCCLKDHKSEEPQKPSEPMQL